VFPESAKWRCLSILLGWDGGLSIGVEGLTGSWLVSLHLSILLQL
jgi:hypothetical protein